MQAAVVTTQPANSTLWVGRILSALSVLFLVFDGVIKLINIQPVVDASLQLGIPVALAPNIGLLLLACTAVYLLPRTSILGAILLTGFLGGASAIQMRAATGAFPILFPVIIGVLLWVGLYLRDRQLRALVSLRG